MNASIESKRALSQGMSRQDERLAAAGGPYVGGSGSGEGERARARGRGIKEEEVIVS